MALVIADRVREFSSTTGTGTLTLSGAAVGYQDFASAIGVGNTCYYAIYNPATNEWEVGLGTVGSSTLARTSVLASSNSGSLVDFTAGSKDVFVTYPAAKSVYTDLAQTLTNKTMSGASNTFTNIPNSALTNTSVTIGSTTISLGGTTSTLSDVSLINPSFSGASFTDLSFTGTFTGTGTAVIESNSNTLSTLRLTQLGTAAALTVEDSSNPDSTPFVVTGTGNVGIGNTGNSVINVYNTKAITGGTTAYSNFTLADVQSDVTSVAYGNRLYLGTQAASFTLSSLVYNDVTQGTFGSGSTVTNQYGVLIGSSLTGAVNNYGFYSNLAANADVAISTISRVGTDVTVNTSTAHGLTTGDRVAINLVADNTYNGIYTVTGAPTTTQFTYSTTTSSTGSSSGGYSTKYNRINVYTNTAPSLLNGNAVISVGCASPALRITQIGTGNAFVVEDSANPDSTPFVINSGGTVVVGNASAIGVAGGSPQIQNHSTGASGSLISTTRWVASTSAGGVTLAHSRGATIGDYTSLASGDSFGSVSFQGTDGTGFIEGANIVGQVDGTPGTNDMPGRLVFSTTADGASSPTERMRLDSAGNLGLGVTPSAWGSIFKPIQLGNAYAYVAGRTDGIRQIWLGANNYYNGTNWIYGLSQPASQYYQNDGSHIWNTAPSGTAGNPITFTQAMTLDASGRLLLGTTGTPASSGVRQVISGGTSNYLEFFGTGNSGTAIGNSNDNMLFFTLTGAIGSETYTERMRIDSAGNLGLGVTPSAWSGYKGFEMGRVGLGLWQYSNSFGITSNAYNNAGWKYAVTGLGASLTESNAGAFNWYNAPSGTAGNPVTFTQAMTLDASGNLVVNGTTPTFAPATSGLNMYYETDTGIGTLGSFSTGGLTALTFHTSGSVNTTTERMRIDSSGNMLVGTTSSQSIAGNVGILQLETPNAATNMSMVRNTASTAGPRFSFGKSRGAAAGGVTIVASGDELGSLIFNGTDGTQYVNAAAITATVDGTPGTNDMPGRLGFWTTPDGSSAYFERMRIGSAGEVGIGNAGATHVNLYLGRTVPGTSSAGYSFYNAPTFDNTSSVSAYVNQTAPSVAASSALANIYHYVATAPSLGAGATLSSQYGFWANINANTATTAYQFYGNSTAATTGNAMYGLRLRIGTSTGTNYNLYLDGAAPNYLAGDTSIGTTSSSGKLHVYNATSGNTGVYSETTGSGYAFNGNAGTSGYILGGTTGGLGLVNLTSTEAGTSAFNFNLRKDSASPANGDGIGLIRFYGNTSTDLTAVTEYGRFSVVATTVTAGAMSGTVTIYTQAAGSLATAAVFTGTSTVTMPGVYNSTTASAANVFVASGGLLSRSTSSAQYKTDIESLEPMRSEAIYQMRPVWYRSLCAMDNENWSWYGFIAEEMAAIEPRLVHWGYADDQYDEVIVGGEGQESTERVLKADAVMQPEGVQYDRITVFLVEEMQKMKAKIESLEAEVAALKSV